MSNFNFDTGVNGFSPFGQRVSFKLTPYDRLITFDPVIEVPTTEPTPNGNVNMEVLATDVPTVEPAGFFYPAGTPTTYGGMYQTLYQIIVFNPTAANITLYCKYVTNPATPTWSSQQSSTITPSSFQRIIISAGMNTSHAVGAIQQFKFYASATGLIITDIAKSVAFMYPSTWLKEPVANLRIRWGNDFNCFGLTMTGLYSFSIRATYPTGGSSETAYSADIASAKVGTTLEMPFYYPHASYGFGLNASIMNYQVSAPASTYRMGRVLPVEISYNRIRY